MFRTRSHKRDFLDFWNSRMSTPNVQPLFDSVVIAVLHKQGFHDIPYIPRNIYKPEALYESLSYYDPERSIFVDLKCPEVQAGGKLVWKCFARPKTVAKLKPVRLDGALYEVYDLLGIKGDKSAGLTAYGETKLEAFPTAMRKVRETLLKQRNPEPCLAGTRTQAGKVGRLVWGYPLSMTIIEGVIARPLLKHFKKFQNTPMAFARPSAMMGIQMRKAASHNEHYVCMDASKFDATVQAGVIKYAFNALRTWFDLNEEIGFGVTVGEVFDIVENYFIHTPIVMPSENGPILYSGKRHGVPSGSYFTQIIDSIANVMMIGTLDFKFKLGIRQDEIFVLGDDMLFFTNKKPNLARFANLLLQRFGMKVNASKSSTGRATSTIPFLGRDWTNGVPTRSFEKVVARAVAPERYRKYGEDKWLGASAVIGSYGLTSMITHMPQNFDPYGGLASTRIVENATSGLTALLQREGLITKRFKVKLY